ncbi:hypothetical protein ACVWXO_007887 [Bradyrhizobium sp. LM2.7]
MIYSEDRFAFFRIMLQLAMFDVVRSRAPALQRTAEDALRCVRGTEFYSSGNPSISRMFCTAAPEAPLPRLSSRATSTAW